MPSGWDSKRNEYFQGAVQTADEQCQVPLQLGGQKVWESRVGAGMEVREVACGCPGADPGAGGGEGTWAVSALDLCVQLVPGDLVPSSDNQLCQLLSAPPSASHSQLIPSLWPPPPPREPCSSLELLPLCGDTHPTAHLGAEWLRGPGLEGSPGGSQACTPVWDGQRPTGQTALAGATG